MKDFNDFVFFVVFLKCWGQSSKSVRKQCSNLKDNYRPPNLGFLAICSPGAPRLPFHARARQEWSFQAAPSDPGQKGEFVVFVYLSDVFFILVSK